MRVPKCGPGGDKLREPQREYSQSLGVPARARIVQDFFPPDRPGVIATCQWHFDI